MSWHQRGSTSQHRTSVWSHIIPVRGLRTCPAPTRITPHARSKQERKSLRTLQGGPSFCRKTRDSQALAPTAIRCHHALASLVSPVPMCTHSHLPCTPPSGRRRCSHASLSSDQTCPCAKAIARRNGSMSVSAALGFESDIFVWDSAKQTARTFVLGLGAAAACSLPGA